MPAPTWCPIDADKCLVYLAKESTEGTHTTTSARQIHFLSGAHTLGHVPVQRPPHPGGRQKVKLDSEILGRFNPAFQLVFPLRYEDLQMLMEAALGGASVAGAWSIASELPTYSIGLNDTVNYWKYSGMKVRAWTIIANPGSTAELQLDFGGLLREEAATSVYTALALTTSPTYSPYTWEEMTILGGATSSPATSLKPVSMRIGGGNGLHITPAPGSRYPNCQPAGRLEVAGQLSFPFSSEFHSTFQAALLAYSTYYLQFGFSTTTGAKAFTIKMPSSLLVPSRAMPEGSTPQVSDLNFMCHADSFALTVPTILATSTAY